MGLSLLDAVIANRLQYAGAPQQAAIDTENPTVSPGTDVYSADPAKLTTLSGYGQLLSAASRFSDSLSSSGLPASSDTPSVANVTAVDGGATGGSYTLSVTKTAKAQEKQSTAANITDPSAVLYGAGLFTIQTSSAAKATAINVTTGSLNGVRDAINSANAGVTASVGQNSSGKYYLSIKGNQTGANADTFTIATPGNPKTSFSAGITALGFTQTQSPDSAVYSINGGTAVTSTSNDISFGNGIQATLTGAGTATVSFPKSANTDNSAVATAIASASTTPGQYAISVTQAAKAQELQSAAYAIDPTAVQYGTGAFTIQTSTAASATTVNVSTGSLNGIRDAINGANAGVTASVGQNSFGYYLSIKGNQTGANGDTITINSSTDPLTSFRNSLGQLGLTQTQSPQDAIYSIDGVSATSSSNSISFANGGTLNLVGAGTANVSVGQSLSGVIKSAQTLVNNYNALLGSLTVLQSSNGSLNGDATASALQASLFSTATSAISTNNGSSLLDLSQIGITAASSSDPLYLDINTLTSAYNGSATDSLGTSALLDTISTSLKSLADSYTAKSGAIQTQGQATAISIQDDINNTIGSYNSQSVPSFVTTLLAQRAFANSGTINLPGFSTYA